MRQSSLFAKTSKTAPTDAVSANAALLERGAFVYKNSAGVYSYLPLGWRVIRKIADIVRQEMDALGSNEMLMPALVDKKYLEATDRWGVDVGYRVRGIGEAVDAFALGWTHEEVLTEIVSHHINSYRDLPFSAYQVQTKFRNEARAKSGILRGKEFIMKDMYSFHATQEDFESFYEKTKQAYANVFARCGLDAYCTRAAGGAFTGNITHEFQVVSPVGEDVIYVCPKCRYAENKEVATVVQGDACPECKGVIEEKTAIEVGNIFPLGTKYSDAFNLTFTAEDGVKKPVIMGSYGIGVSRLMGAITEVHHDEAGLVWPASVAPFAVHLLDFTKAGDAAKNAYEALQKRGVAVLWDDRQTSAGDKLATADLLGIPVRAVISEKTGDMIEIKRRDSAETKLGGIADLI
jgi:prolyl-tRNA synthetase